MTRILALDLATRVGWACGRPNEEPRFGTKVLPSTGEDIGRFASAFDEWLSDMVTRQDPSLIVFEAPILSADKTTPATARKLMGLAWHTELVAFRRERQCREANLMTVKKFFSGSGRATKDDMMAAARRYGWNIKTDDEADALAIWSYTVDRIAPATSERFKLGLLGAAE